MTRPFEIALGILTAIGGFVEIGELVAMSLIGARFGLNLAWALVIAVIGIIIFAEMSGRVAAVSQRPVFDVVRERLGPSIGLVNLVGSFVITAATAAAEIAAVALAIELVTSVAYLLWIPLVGFGVWLVIWRVNFKVMENVTALLGLLLAVVVVAVFRMDPDWGVLAGEALHPSIPDGEGGARYWYFAIGILGAAFMPYEVFFFSSGAVEEGWTRKDLLAEKSNAIAGFAVGGVLALGFMAASALFLQPRGIEVEHLSHVVLPTAMVLGKIGLAVLLVGIVAATFGAALETSLSCGYMIAQYFGWQWGKFVPPMDDARFHAVTLVTVFGASMLVLTGIDPIHLTEILIVFSAIALPLTYFPVLVVANDPSYMGAKTNRALSNALGLTFFGVLVVASIAAIPLMIVTKAGS